MGLDAALRTSTEPRTVHVERGRLRLFAKATGQTDPLYTSVEAARAAGYPDLLVPPTFLMSLELEQPDPFAWLTALGVDLRQLLHGGQAFEYHRPAVAGDKLTVVSTVTDVYAKKGGALQFLERTTRVTRGVDDVATLQQTTVVVEAAP